MFGFLVIVSIGAFIMEYEEIGIIAAIAAILYLIYDFYRSLSGGPIFKLFKLLLFLCGGFILVYGLRFARWIGKQDSGADAYLEDQLRQNREMLANHRANQEKKKELLYEADRLDKLARYGMPYERKRLKKEADELRRQANNL